MKTKLKPREQVFAEPRPGPDERDDFLAALVQRPRRREVWVGAFVILGLLAVLVSLFTLTDAALFRGRYIVTTVVDDAAGIRKGDPVQMRGVNIGRIQRFQIVPQGVAVRLELEGEYAVPADSRVMLASRGLLGGVVAEIVPGQGVTRLRGGDVMPGQRVEGMFDAAATIGDQADLVLTRVQSLLSDQTVGAVGESATELRLLLAELSALATEQRRELSEVSRSLRGAASSVDQATSGPELARAVARLDSLMGRLDGASLSLQGASLSLDVVLGRIQRGEGTLGRLSADPALYDNLRDAAETVRSLAADIKENPRRYIELRVF
jgi:phospholipid/cholesterol/gamma-HCH transport system substrate-binding protein